MFLTVVVAWIKVGSPGAGAAYFVCGSRRPPAGEPLADHDTICERTRHTRTRSGARRRAILDRRPPVKIRHGPVVSRVNYTVRVKQGAGRYLTIRMVYRSARRGDAQLFRWMFSLVSIEPRAAQLLHQGRTCTRFQMYRWQNQLPSSIGIAGGSARPSSLLRLGDERPGEDHRPLTRQACARCRAP